MTPEEFAQRMHDVLFQGPEEGHHEADDLMCQVLRELGYGAGIDFFERMGKWYA